MYSPTPVALRRRLGSVAVVSTVHKQAAKLHGSGGKRKGSVFGFVDEEEGDGLDPPSEWISPEMCRRASSGVAGSPVPWCVADLFGRRGRRQRGCELA